LFYRLQDISNSISGKNSINSLAHRSTGSWL
jgi:hypothetical protein